MLVVNPTIGDQLRDARLKQGLSQAELAQKLGIRQGTISNAERGLDMRVGTLLEIARALDLELFLAPRRMHGVIKTFTNSTDKHGQSAIYTGNGDEPYSEVDEVEDAPMPQPLPRERVQQ